VLALPVTIARSIAQRHINEQEWAAFVFRLIR
jgi:hypothetical protein